MTIAVALLILVLVTAQRIGELVLARRNTRALLAAGAKEYSPRHYPLIVALHGVWLVGLWWLGWDGPVVRGWLVVFLVLQALRVWVIRSLGARWTTRIIVPPGQAPVRRGPYRFLRHPNYLVVAAEIAVLPLVFGSPLYALAFTFLNAGAMTLRIPAENRAWKAASQ